MFDLQDKIIARGTELLDGQTFFDPAAGGPAAMRWFPLGLVAKRKQSGQGRDYPFTEVGVLSGKETFRKAEIRALLVTGLHVGPDTNDDGIVDAGDDQAAAARAAMQRVIDAYRGLGWDCNYAPYSLEELSWFVGDEHGNHPGPDKFYLSAELVFLQEPAINNY